MKKMFFVLTIAIAALQSCTKDDEYIVLKDLGNFDVDLPLAPAREYVSAPIYSSQVNSLDELLVTPISIVPKNLCLRFSAYCYADGTIGLTAFNCMNKPVDPPILRFNIKIIERI